MKCGKEQVCRLLNGMVVVVLVVVVVIEVGGETGIEW